MLAGLVLVATAQVSNMILARAVAGTIPPFALAFCRWGIIALALSPFAGAVRTSLILYLGPVVSALLSYLILGEPPGLIHFIGGALILAGVWASLRR